MAKRESTSPITTLVPTEPDDLTVIQQVGVGVIAFLKNAAAFLKKANSYEQQALDVLAAAKKLTKPTNSADDVKLQTFVKSCNQSKAVAEEHWNGTKASPGPSALLFRLHRRVVARRDVAVNALVDAATIGNGLHNAYTVDERRRAQVETDRLQAIEDAKAKKLRDEELARLEAEARRTRKPGKADSIREQAAAIAAQPIEAPIVEVKPNIAKAVGATDRTTRSAEVLNEADFIDAVFAGTYGIPRDVLTINQVKLNQYARDLKEPIVNQWPGVRVKAETKVV
jgi:hypothetical protein